MELTKKVDFNYLADRNKPYSINYDEYDRLYIRLGITDLYYYLFISENISYW